MSNNELVTIICVGSRIVNLDDYYSKDAQESRSERMERVVQDR
jgi:hypothetical protein